MDGRQPLMEDNLQWKTTFNGRQPLMEDDLRWKMTFDGRWPSIKDNLWCKTTFNIKVLYLVQLNSNSKILYLVPVWKYSICLFPRLGIWAKILTLLMLWRGNRIHPKSWTESLRERSDENLPLANKKHVWEYKCGVNCFWESFVLCQGDCWKMYGKPCPICLIPTLPGPWLWCILVGGWQACCWAILYSFGLIWGLVTLLYLMCLLSVQSFVAVWLCLPCNILLVSVVLQIVMIHLISSSMIVISISGC